MVIVIILYKIMKYHTEYNRAYTNPNLSTSIAIVCNIQITLL